MATQPNVRTHCDAPDACSGPRAVKCVRRYSLPDFLTQLNLDGQDQIATAIQRLKAHEPEGGYWLAFSGGKDSVVLYDLAVRSGVCFDAHLNVVGLEPPELLRFIREHYPAVQWERQEENIWQACLRHGILPTRLRRWCCGDFKERGGDGRIVLTGVRWAESRQRSKRRMVEQCTKRKGTLTVNPIIDWTNGEVWAYIRGRGLRYCSLYDEGFTRLGCILCPMVARKALQHQRARWPQYERLWRQAADAVCAKRRAKDPAFPFQDGAALFEWWIARFGKMPSNTNAPIAGEAG